MIRVGIIDDEPLARTGLRRALAAMPGVEVVCEASNAREAERTLALTRPQGVFLDIRMPGASGFELLSRIEKPPRVVFVTAHSGHAVQAFEVEAVDYVLKPVEPARLARAVERLRSALGDEVGTTPFGEDDRVCLHTPGRTIVAAVGDIVCLQADGDFCRFTLADGQTPFICRTLGSFLEQLPSPPIHRLDRSLAVNIRRIRRVERAGGHSARVWLEGANEPQLLGRAAAARLKTALAGGETT